MNARKVFCFIFLIMILSTTTEKVFGQDSTAHPCKIKLYVEFCEFSINHVVGADLGYLCLTGDSLFVEPYWDPFMQPPQVDSLFLWYFDWNVNSMDTFNEFHSDSLNQIPIPFYFPDSGIYHLDLSIVYLSDSDSVYCGNLATIDVHVVLPPIADFTSQDSFCIGSQICFTNVSQVYGGDYNVDWYVDTNNPTSGFTDCSPVTSDPMCEELCWTFNQAGIHTVMLIVQRDIADTVFPINFNDTLIPCCTDTIIKQITIVSPEAHFGYTVDCSQNEFIVQFNDLSQCDTSWLWNFGDPGSGTADTSSLQNPIHTYTSPGTYSVNLSINGGPWAETQQIQVDLLPETIILGDSIACDTGAVQYTIANYDSNYSYTWTIINGTPSSGTGSSINVQWTWSGGYVIVTTSNHVCTNTDTLHVKACCITPENLPASYNYYNNASVSNILADLGVGNSVTNQTLYINGTLTCNATAIFDHCRFFFYPHTAVNVNNNITLELRNDTLSAMCDTMWRGIFLPNSTTRLVVTNSWIQDADSAITSIAGGKYTVTHSRFDRNYKHVVVKSYFSIQAILSTTSRSWYTCQAPLIYPHFGEQTLYAIDINNVVPIVIGDLTNATYDNFFSGYKTGINAYRSTVYVYNNTFNNYQTSLYSTAIKSRGIISPPSTYWLVVDDGNISQNNPTFANQFENGPNGINVHDNINVRIQDNSFKDIDLSAVIVATCRKKSLDISFNTISNSTTGIWMLDDPGCSPFNVKTNTISANPNQIGTSGIVVEKSIADQTAHPFIGYNYITGAQLGIVQSFFFGGHIQNNVIYLPAALTNTPNRGIHVMTGSGNFIETNDVYGVSGDIDLLYGIQVDQSPTATICQNTIYDCERGLGCLGSMPNTRIKINHFENCDLGFVLENLGVVGQQGTYNSPHDNQWVNIGIADLYTRAGTDGTISPFWCKNYPTYYWPFISDNNLTPPPSINIDTFLANNGAFGNYGCGTGGGNLTGGGGGSTLLSILEGSYLYQENAYLARQVVYEVAKDDSSLLLSEPVIDAFVDSAKSANLGLYGLIDFKLDSALVNYDPAKIFEAEGLNSSFNPTIEIEEYNKLINQIMIEHFTDSVTRSWSSSEMADIDFVGMQCPYNSGIPVYRAHTLSGYEDAVYHDRGQWCNSVYMRQNNDLNKNPENHVQGFTVNLYPNPNNGEFTISLSGLSIEQCSLEIYDLMGSLLKTVSLKESNSDLKLELSNGIYFYRLVNNNLAVYSDKIIICK